MTKKRLSAEDRKKSILESALPLFAKQGFQGTTTRQLADAAGVSEALLYRYFPSKQDIYLQLKEVCFDDSAKLFNHCEAFVPSTQNLINQVYMLIYLMLADDNFFGVEQKTIKRLMAYSNLEDGGFAKIVIDNFSLKFFDQFDQNLKAAEGSGDLVDVPINHNIKMWLVHHVGVGFSMVNMQPTIDYKITKEEMLQQMVHFTLRGIGLKDEAIKKYFKPNELNQIVSMLAGA